MDNRKCLTDLSDDEWRCIRPHLPDLTGRGRPRLHGLRAILDAVLYVLKSGCPWRWLPRDFPPWKTGCDWFRRWRIDGTWKFLNAEMRERLRCQLGRNPKPSAGIVNSQSVETTGVGGKECGFDPAKKVDGRWRHLFVDTEGLVLEARVLSARVPDQNGIRLLLEQVRGRFARLSHLRVDASYQGRGRNWVEEDMGLSVEVVRKPSKPVPEKVAEVWAREWSKEGKKVDWEGLTPQRGFQVLPRRWVVERTFAWICHNSRMAKDHERLCDTGEGLRLRGDDAAHAEAVGSCVGHSRQSLEETFREFRPEGSLKLVQTKSRTH